MCKACSQVGFPKEALDTPALWVDLDIMERNIQVLADFFRRSGVGWRPHMKGIKVPAIAHKLLEAGAHGVTCAKLGEAEVLAAAGIRDILVANQVVGEQKVRRLVYLRKTADVMVAVDSLENAQEISRAAQEAGVQVRVLVEVNTGMNRCGVEPGEAGVRFAGQVAELPGLRFTGFMSWEGHVVAIPDKEEKRRVCTESVGRLVRTAEMARQAGLPVDIVSCGGSGSYWITAGIPGVTEIQAGGAVFTDVTYRRWGVPLEPSLFLLTTIISRPTARRAVCDAGRKAIDNIVSTPEVVGVPGARVGVLSAEHGILELAGPEVPLRVGDKIDLIVGYGDLTVYKHDYLYGVRNGIVEVQWEVMPRSALR
ncbi:MAG: DSD1 family PLP-dependent enzyme [Anaerolineae bacterium]|nr:DSD1 family PLP-dependent enzyme [Anaerolineae bacterium]